MPEPKFEIWQQKLKAEESPGFSQNNTHLFETCARAITFPAASKQFDAPSQPSSSPMLLSSINKEIQMISDRNHFMRTPETPNQTTWLHPPAPEKLSGENNMPGQNGNIIFQKLKILILFIIPGLIFSSDLYQ